ncbi:MAG TPA: hypothetical protein VJH92_06520 [Candidatus Nanoarchaeia archaeon]|nr:hypothetical protein [Candidatus Nanoarchaeia archaeon]
MERLRGNAVKYFVLSLIITLVIARITGTYFNTNPQILGFEFHHFDYGIILLLIALLLQAFNSKKELTYVFFGTSLGLILDELYYMRVNFVESVPYSSTFLPSLIISIIVLTLILIVNKNSKK